MTEEKKYYDYLFQVLNAHNLVPDQTFWRDDLERAVDFLGIEKHLLRMLKEHYHAQFAEVVLINSNKCLWARHDFGMDISKSLCVAAVYFSLLGCLLDFWLDGENKDWKRMAKEKLSWNHCKRYFVDFDFSMPVNDEADRIFVYVSEGLKQIYDRNRKLYDEIIDRMKNAAKAEIVVAEAGNSVSEELIYNKSVLFSDISLLMALGDKEEWKTCEYEAIKQVGFLYAYIDDVIDVFEDFRNHQGNIYLRELEKGVLYTDVIDKAISDILKTIEGIGKGFSLQFKELIRHEVAEWIYSNEELMQRLYEK